MWTFAVAQSAGSSACSIILDLVFYDQLSPLWYKFI